MRNARADKVSIRLITLAIVVIATACQSDRQSPSGPRSEVRDSVGIQVVENSRPPGGSRLAWRIGPEPTVTIGVLEGEDPYQLFHATTDATKLSDGRIVVVDRGTAELRVFDEFGTHLATWGGEGEGPGEFEDVMQIATLPGDSLITWGLLEIYEIGEDYILGHTRDEMDVEYVQVWPLDRSGS